MGSGSSRPAPPPPPPPKCSVEKAQADYWSKVLKDTTKVYTEKQLASDSCSPEQAAARQLGGPSECQTNDVKLGMAQSDVANMDKKWEQCYPDQAIQRKLRLMTEDAAKYTASTKSAQTAASGDYSTKAAAIEKLSLSAQELYKTLYEKEKELAGVVGIRQNNEQLERRERRAFLDNDPQGGVGGVPGIRTADDRSLFAFWITYGAAVIAVCVALLNVYGMQIGITNAKSKTAITVLVGAVAYSVAYYFISFYG